MRKNKIPYYIELELHIKKILEILNKHGEGYVVGGYIRDKILKLSPKDCDFVTNIPYSELKNIFSNYSPKEIGKQFGVLQIRYKGQFYEVAKYRLDLGVPTKRNEQLVTFTDNIYEDLVRRDFTVNSLAYDGENLVFLDSALSDLLHKKALIFNGNPEKRVLEDPLRLLRGIRFSITRQLSLENREVYRENIHLISKLSIERIRDEFVKILLSDYPLEGVKRLIELGAMKYIIPEIIPMVNLDGEEKQERVSVDYKSLEESPKDLETRLYILLKNLPHREILFRLKFSKKIVLRVEELKTPFSKKNLNITGKELQELGFTGKEIGECLTTLLNLVLEEKLQNIHEELIAFVQQNRVVQEKE